VLADRPSLKSRYIYDFKKKIEVGRDSIVHIAITIDSVSGNIFTIGGINGSHDPAVHVFSQDGTYLRTIGEKSGLQSPKDIIVDHYGCVVVLDCIYARVLDTKTGHVQLKFGTVGGASGVWTSPNRITIDLQGNFLVSDSGQHRIHVFSSFGKWIKRIGSYGNAPGKFNFPTGLACDGNNNLIVGDYNNHRIQILDPLRNPIRIIRLPHHLGRFCPAHVIVDKNGDIVCSDMQGRVRIFSRDGEVVVSQIGTDFLRPGAAAIDANGNLVIVDQSNRDLILMFG
jgi:tripartite motif-containing protein 71